MSLCYICCDLLDFICDSQNTPIVPLGRNPRTDILLEAEDAVLEVGGCVLRLAGLYISFSFSEDIKAYCSDLSNYRIYEKSYPQMKLVFFLDYLYKSDRGAQFFV